MKAEEEQRLFEAQKKKRKKSFKIAGIAVVAVAVVAIVVSIVGINIDEKNRGGCLMELSKNGEYYIVTSYSGDSTDLVIPSEYKGKPVKEIAAAAFKKDGLTSVTIPDSVTSIGWWAFHDCTNLTSAIFENSEGWYYTFDPSSTSGTGISSSDLANYSTAAYYLTDYYYEYYWKRR